MKMKTFVLLTALFASVYSQIVSIDSNCGLGTNIRSDEKIVGGTQVPNGNHGWQIMLMRNGQFICGGSLVNSLWVVTAAHCVFGNLNAGSYSVIVGLNDRNNNNAWTVTKTVSRVVMHQSYNNNNYRNDIAMIKLSSAVLIDTTYYKVVPVCIPTGTEAYEGRTSYATGWGTLYSGGPTSRYLMQVALPVLATSRCSAKYPNLIDQYTQVCAGETGQNKDTCQGDSGGPLVVKGYNGRWHLVGITSFGYGCGDGGVYTRVSGFANWIVFTMQNN